LGIDRENWYKKIEPKPVKESGDAEKDYRTTIGDRKQSLGYFLYRYSFRLPSNAS
jgi:hypothetical protein